MTDPSVNKASALPEFRPNCVNSEVGNKALHQNRLEAGLVRQPASPTIGAYNPCFQPQRALSPPTAAANVLANALLNIRLNQRVSLLLFRLREGLSTETFRQPVG